MPTDLIAPPRAPQAPRVDIGPAQTTEGKPESHGYTRGYIRELDGLRGIAIALVLLNHFWPRTGPLAGAFAVIGLGWIGVDLFFAISGYLITGILLDTRED